MKYIPKKQKLLTLAVDVCSESDDGSLQAETGYTQ